MQKRTVTRRDFVKSGAVAVAAIGLPTVVPSTVIGKDAPSGRVNIGLIGCGSISRYYHRNILKRMDDVRIVAVCDAYKDRRDKAVVEMDGHYKGKVAKAHADFREVLARSDVDAVIIAAHDNWHTPMSIAAAKAGKDVYCQKPLALDLSRTAILRKVVNENKRIFQFGTQYRSQGRWRQLVELVRNGYIGKLKRIDVWSRDLTHDAKQYNVKPYGSDVKAPIPAGFNFDAWQGPSPMVPYTVDRATRWGGFHCPETSLGFLAGCGIHPLGIAQWGNKSDDTSPIRYEGTGTMPTKGIFRTLERWDVKCDYANGVQLRFMDCRTAKGAMAKILPNWRNGDGVYFHGTEGWIGSSWAFIAEDQRLWKQKFKSSDERLPVVPEHNRNFIECVKSRKETICPVEMGIRTDTICHMTNVAALTGRVIKWDPKKEQIIGDAEAAKMITRPHRKEWKVW
ncbi:MAG: Gfo/Idh/MocA family oxidoreductase [Phycisphaerales bacterium]|jgi:hypothetical protein|nr:Gfo/Idh/MocA family oxidoreductase [Phycisphaerales bacterium]